MRVNQFDTLSEAMTSLQERGFVHNYEVDELGCFDVETGEHIDPDEISIVEHHRFEGDSSSDDMSIVYALECVNGHDGLIVDSYGLYANDFMAAFLNQIQIEEEY